MNKTQMKQRCSHEGGTAGKDKLETYQVCDYLGWGRTTLHNVRKTDVRFPKPIKQGARKLLWDRKEVDEYLERGV